MIRSIILVATAVMASLLFASPLHAQTGCAEGVRAAARVAVSELSKEKAFIVGPGVAKPIIDEIAIEICKPDLKLTQNAAEDAARKVARGYFENAVSLGRSTRVASLFAEVLSGNTGLGRPDRRNYGTVTVKCPANLTGAIVAVAGSESGPCTGRFLTRAGNTDIRVERGPTPICTGKAEVKARSDVSCECIPNAQSPASMTCS